MPVSAVTDDLRTCFFGSATSASSRAALRPSAVAALKSRSFAEKFRPKAYSLTSPLKCGSIASCSGLMPKKEHRVVRRARND